MADPTDKYGKKKNVDETVNVSDEATGDGISAANEDAEDGARADILRSMDLRASPQSGVPASLPGSRSPLIDAISVLREPLSSSASDTRRLAQKLAVHWFRGNDVHPALSIISAERGEGRTTTAINLACVYAQAAVRTLLVDADLHSPSIHKLLDLDPDGSESGTPCAVEGVPNLSVLPASHLSKGPQERLVPSALGGLISRFRAQFDVILVDTPAASTGEDYLFAALATRGGLVVTREGTTKVKAIAKVLNSCEDAGVKIVGGTMIAMSVLSAKK